MEQAKRTDSSEPGQLLAAKASASGRLRFATDMRASLRESRVFLAAVLAQAVIGAIMARASHRPFVVDPLDSYDAFFTAAVGFGAIALLVVLFRARLAVPAGRSSSDAYREAWSSVRNKYFTPLYCANALIALLAAPFALSVFSAAKQTIPVLHAFSWDARIARLGSIIHGGRDLSQWIDPALRHPMLTLVLDRYYHVFWPSLMVGAFVFATLMPASPLRRRYLVAALLVFLIVGNLAALFLSSAGPAYYANVVVGPADPYGALMQYLHSVDARYGLISAADQRSLWFAYSRGLEGFGAGISAMPSVHIASATLCALFGAALDKRLGIALGLAVLLMFVGSVNLGWHYALDGYVGAALAYAIWLFAGRITRTSIS